MATPPRRLDSWKSIAEYLSRDVRTVQRWHAQAGLPVHHVAGRVRSVYALTDQIDAWLQSGNAVVARDETPVATKRARPRPLFLAIAAGLAAAGVALVSLASGPPRERDSVGDATRLANVGNWQAARLLLERAAERDPANPRVLIWLATMRANTGSTGDAVSAPVERALALRSDATPETRSLVEAFAPVLLGRGSDECIAAFDAHLATYPDDEWAHRFLAYELMRADRFTEAIAHLDAVARLWPDDFSSQAEAAIQKSWANADPAGARQLVHRARSLLSDNPADHSPVQAAFVLAFPALDAWREGRLRESIRLAAGAWDDAARRSPAIRDGVAIMLASLHGSLGQPERAETLAGVLADPNRRRAIQARHAYQRGDLDHARQLLSQVPPGSGGEGFEQFAQVGLLSEAQASFEFLSRHAIPPPTASDFEVITALARGDDRRALDAAGLAVSALYTSCRTGNLGSAAMFGDALRRVGRVDEAIALLERALSCVVPLHPYGVMGHEWLEARLSLRDALHVSGAGDRAARLTTEVSMWLAEAELDSDLLQRLNTPPH